MLVVTYSLQRLFKHLPSIQICPSGRRATSALCTPVSVLFLGVVFLFQINNSLRITKMNLTPTTMCCSFSSCIDLFPLFQSSTTAASLDRCAEVHGSLYKVIGQVLILVPVPPPVLLDTVVAPPVRSCPIQMPIPSQQQLPVQFARLVHMDLLLKPMTPVAVTVPPVNILAKQQAFLYVKIAPTVHSPLSQEQDLS